MRAKHLIVASGLALITSCDCPPAWVAPGACEEDGTIEVDLEAWGPAPWDGFSLDHEAHLCDLADLDEGRRVLVDEAGQEVATEVYGLCEREGRREGLEPGTYSFLGWEDVPTPPPTGSWDFMLDEPLTFTVDPWGRDPDFEPANVAGRIYELPLEGLARCGAATLLLFAESSGAAFLRMGEPEDGEAGFDLLWGTYGEHEGASDCRIMSGTATLSETGELTWLSDHETWDDDPLVEAWSLYLHLGFDASGAALAGAETDVLLQGAALSRRLLGEDDGLCAFAGGCAACPDGSGDTCLPLETFAGLGTASERAFATDLPSCWDLLATEDLPDWSCSSAGRGPGALVALLGLGIVGMVRTRRLSRTRAT
ncbi:MAG: hypothetical protein ABIO70_18105 [Pseudomonadota bacterium]